MANTDITPSGGHVTLRSHTIALDSDIGAAFITDCVRRVENLLTAEQLKRKYELDDERIGDQNMILLVAAQGVGLIDKTAPLVR
jgi:hypothetical protein